MKRILFTALLFSSLSTFAQTNINKGNFLVGGNAAFASTSGDGSASTTSITFSPNFGYFVADRFAIGLQVSFESNSNDLLSSSQSLISPFLRAYLLPSSNNVNIFLQGQYGFGNISFEDNLNGGEFSSSINAFAFSAGPAIFLTPAVALEFGVSYVSLGASGGGSRQGTIGVGAGFQVHLGGRK